MDFKERQESERSHYEKEYGRGWHGEAQPLDEAVIPPNMRIYWEIVHQHASGLLAENGVVHILDCGCGYGVLSVLLATMGARVTAVDVSPTAIDMTGRLARANGVEDRVEALVLGLEDLPFEPGTFHLVVGTRVLHHVDIGRAGPVLARILKPGGRAIFWECTEKNPILRFTRRHVRRVIPLPKYGTEGEHPLTHEEIASLEDAFCAPAEIVPAPFYFFNLVDAYVFRQRNARTSALLGGIDRFLATRLPFLNRFSFHQILMLRRP